ncbi:hypothetical protein K501DRAFT_208077 [Backusella circina FSU 941]|nr:hypothetical protein K501DRAFT_208077 [Backusella circina FSU 941]
MNKEAVTNYAIKKMIGSAFPQEQHRPIELVEQPKKKYWWSKQPKADSILSIEEQRILKAVKSRAHFLDRGLTCCCFQIGFDGLVGLIPVIGDFIGLLLALQLVHLAMEAHLPQSLISKMMFNIAFDFVIGLVPVVGDVMDIMYKCNTKNAILLENYLIGRRQHQMKNPGHREMAKDPLLASSSSKSAPTVIS